MGACLLRCRSLLSFVLGLAMLFPVLLADADPPADPPSNNIELVSVTDGSVGTNIMGSHSPSVSTDGRFITFVSMATNLVGGDTNGAYHIFVRDRQTGTTQKVSLQSLSLGGGEASNHSDQPSISADGRFVSFYSTANNLIPRGADIRDVFIHDRETHETEWASRYLGAVFVAGTSIRPNGQSEFPSVSSSGRYVAFESMASNLVAGDTLGQRDIFVYDSDTDMMERVSVSSSGEQGNSHSFSASFSNDGQVVAFESYATNFLVAGGTPSASASRIFVRDRSSHQTSLVSISSEGTAGLGKDPSISANGQIVAFSSFDPNLVEEDEERPATGSTSTGPLGEDIFVHDRESGETSRVSVNSSGVGGNNDSEYPSISANGRFVAFVSLASNLVEGDINGRRDIFIHDRDTGETTRVSESVTGIQGNDTSGAPSISADGCFVAFHSHASNLVSGDVNLVSDVFVAQNPFADPASCHLFAEPEIICPEIIDDGNPCTLDRCDPESGLVHEVLSGNSCDDANACTTGDACSSGGACVGGASLALPPNGECFTNSCDPSRGIVRTNKPSGTRCAGGRGVCMGENCKIIKTIKVTKPPLLPPKVDAPPPWWPKKPKK